MTKFRQYRIGKKRADKILSALQGVKLRRKKLNRNGSSSTSGKYLYQFWGARTMSGGARMPKTVEEKMLLKRILRSMKKSMPGFTCTNVRVQKGYKSPQHNDTGDVGETAILCVGDYSDGVLLLHEYNQSGGQKPPIEVNCRHQWFRGDLFKIRHSTGSFRGNRVCIVAHTPRSGVKTRKFPGVLKKLRKFGFPTPSLEKTRKQISKQKAAGKKFPQSAWSRRLRANKEKFSKAVKGGQKNGVRRRKPKKVTNNPGAAARSGTSRTKEAHLCRKVRGKPKLRKCTRCNVSFLASNWSAHRSTKMHQNG